MPTDPKIGPGNDFLVDKEKNLVYQIGSDGKRFYYSPASITPAQLAESQAGVAHDPANYYDTSQIPDNSLLHERGQWNPQSGKFETPINWTNLASLGVGGMIAAPLIAPLLTGAAPAAGGGGGVGIGETASTYGLASGAGLPGASGIPTAAGIGAGAGTGVGVGETASSWGLGTGAGLPGATGAPVAGIGAGAAAPIGLAPGSTAAETSSAVGGKMGLGSILGNIAKSYGGGGGNSWIPQAIQAGTSLAQGYLGSRASNKAAEQQIAATNQAKQELGGIYQQQQQLQAPWISSGMASLGALNRGLGLNPQPVPGFQSGAGQLGGGSNVPIARPDRQGTIVDQAMPRQTVMLRAPTGQTMAVSGDQVAHFLSKGAVRV